MKIAIHFHNADKWQTIRKVKNLSITDTFVILTMLDETVKVLKRKDIKYIRETKLYEGMKQ